MSEIKCKNCGVVPAGYMAKYDAYYCMGCGDFLKEKCGNKECGFCPDRPAKACGESI